MDIRLPRKGDPPTPDRVQAMEEGLTSVIWGHPQATYGYTFYEVVDELLGPWGPAGYPIGYGKFYNVQFMGDRLLMADPETRDWVERTAVALQEMIRDWIVEQYRQGMLARVTEPELRAFAFGSHVETYSRGGLAKVLLLSPSLLPVIASIPYREFNPFGTNFLETIQQVAESSAVTTVQAAGVGLAAVMPAHSGMLRNAFQRDQRRLLRDQGLIRELGELEQWLRAGRVDNIVWLNRVTRRLNMTQYPEPDMAAWARRVVRMADARKREVARRYRAQLQQRPDLRPVYDQTQPGWWQW